MARFFIDRPIFAWVIAILVMLAGGLVALQLPVEQYPDIAPPTVTVNANYPGADARTIEESVTQVIEQAMNALDNLDFMTSSSSAQGNANVTLTFLAGTDPDVAQVQVQNKLQQALRQLPQPVQAQGLNVTKSTSGFLSMYSFWSSDDSMSRNDLSDYVSSTIIDPLGRINGVAGVRVFGSPYAMRIWLDPFKLTQFKLNPGDVRSAIMAQNTQVSAGQLGGLPALDGQQINATITAQSRLRTVDEFRAITLRVNADGSAVRLDDVARVELGAESYTSSGTQDGKVATGIAISLTANANALETADATDAKLRELARFFPPNIEWAQSYDSAKFVRISIREVLITLIEAMLLVVAIIFLFLENWRATLIPFLAVPVVLLGTLGVMAALGYSINVLTMFAFVLAIGLLVDDAIVVVENVERIMHDEKLPPREATIKSMDQIVGALFGIALVLAAVLLPMAFFGGSTGVIYRQFSITICVAMALSVLVAMILTPALCATLLRSEDLAHLDSDKGFFGWFNRVFRHNSERYHRSIAWLIPRIKPALAVYAVIVGLLAWLYWALPTAFLPNEDRGTLIVQFQLPPGATQQRTQEVQQRFESLVQGERAAISSIMAITGFGFGGSGQNGGMMWLRLKDWDQRNKEQSASAIAQRTSRIARGINDANVFVFAPSGIQGLGQTTGFSFELQDVGGLGYTALAGARDRFLELANQDARLTQVRIAGSPEQPEYKVTVDQSKAAALGLSLSDINDTLSTGLGGSYVNDFINKNRVKKVYLQSDAQYRMQPDHLNYWHVRNRSGEMVPLSAVASAHWTIGPQRLDRYNGVPSLGVSGQGTEGLSSGEAMRAVEEIIAQLPTGIGYEWSGVSKEEARAGSQAPLLYAISILFAFLCLAALYESWVIPFAVMLVVPLGLLGAVLAASARGLSNDVLFQVALLTTVGLTAKNAILIVEFASKLHAQGMELVAATLEAVRIRLRPILMTSLAFMLGVMPLVLAGGAGAASRIAIGTGVFGGMFAATLLGIFFVPLFYLLIQRNFGRSRRPLTR